MFIHRSRKLSDTKKEIEGYLHDYKQHFPGEEYLFLLKDSGKSKFFRFKCYEGNRKAELEEPA